MRFIVLASLTVLGITSASAQLRDTLGTGRVLRWQEGGRWQQGSLAAPARREGPFRLYIETANAERELGLDAAGLSYRVRGSTRVQNAVIGFGIGAVLGALAGAAANATLGGLSAGTCQVLSGRSCRADTSPAAIVGAALLTGAIGAGIGELFAHGAKWQPLGGAMVP